MSLWCFSAWYFNPFRQTTGEDVFGEGSVQTAQICSNVNRELRVIMWWKENGVEWAVLGLVGWTRAILWPPWGKKEGLLSR